MGDRSVSRRRALGLAGVAAVGAGVLRPSLVARPDESIDGDVPVDTWPMVGRDPGRTAFSPRASGPTGEPSVRWRRSFDGHTRPEQVAVGPERVYVRHERSLHAFDRADGRRAWRFRDRDDDAGSDSRWEWVDGGPVIAGDTVYAGTEGLHALASSSGRTKWAITEPVATAPVVAGNTAFLRRDDAVTAVDATSGARRWVTALDDDYYALGLHRGVLVGAVPNFVNDETTLVGIDAGSGDVAWRRSIPRTVSAPETVTCADGRIYVGVEPIASIAVADGSTEWLGSLPDGADRAVLATDGDRLLVLCAVGAAAFDRRTGERRWLARFGRGDGPAPAVAAGPDALYLGADGAVQALDPATGTTRFSRDLDAGSAVASLALTGSTLWVLTEGTRTEVLALADE